MRLICKLSSPSCWISSLAASRKRCSRSATSRCRRSRVPIGCTSEEGANFEFNSKFDQALFPQQQCCKESIRTMPARQQSKKRRVNSGVRDSCRHLQIETRILRDEISNHCFIFRSHQAAGRVDQAQIGRASCRERVCQNVESSVVA